MFAHRKRETKRKSRTMCLFAMSLYIKLNKFICHPKTQRTYVTHKRAHLHSNNTNFIAMPNAYSNVLYTLSPNNYAHFHFHYFIFTHVFIESIVNKTQQASPQQSDYLPINGSNLIGIYSHRVQCPHFVTFTFHFFFHLEMGIRSAFPLCWCTTMSNSSD